MTPAVADVVVNGLLLLGAVFFAAFAPKDQRGDAVAASLVLLFVWILYVASWTSWSPAAFLRSLTGMSVKSPDVWMYTDALAGGAVVLVAFQRWWGWALWASFVGMFVTHVAKSVGLLGFGPYSDILDGLFLAQVALLYLIGGRGVGDRLHRYLDRLRVVRGQAASAHARPAPSERASPE